MRIGKKYFLPEPGRPAQEGFELNIDKWGRKIAINVKWAKHKEKELGDWEQLFLFSKALWFKEQEYQARPGPRAVILTLKKILVAKKTNHFYFGKNHLFPVPSLEIFLIITHRNYKKNIQNKLTEKTFWFIFPLVPNLSWCFMGKKCYHDRITFPVPLVIFVFLWNLLVRQMPLFITWLTYVKCILHRPRIGELWTKCDTQIGFVWHVWCFEIFELVSKLKNEEISHTQKSRFTVSL